ncbi:GNAT family N-acetyltransferase [Flagellimonas halotolerans]|uniref:GNAT family N-acetyltransferase n=1 Tax=Flagellimonas halotolerans TaxID=3112164 RepID=A0ABU6IRC4_9FLAO|nr:MULTISPECIES: GNAT family N-acetyltransferase [unclassified Allomuricauda]MEC3965925.1 GNAT family N-acetyltransferase [Muricauda sp. SYSU M86414]MEC4265609.1 GNAT family N-acetyltransferase [Muricauda sp. SYSU M84420]
MDASFTIIPYSETYKDAFRSLNEEWITKYFQMEEMDRVALHHPKEYILDKGGYIAVALINREPVGVCALIPCQYDGYDFELSKMGVSPKAQGKGIGKLLGQHIIDKAKELGAKKIFLESNRKLTPALSLYKKLGFKEMTKISSPYARSDIQMELTITTA